MLLNDIGKSPEAVFKRINRHLQENYGFKISENISEDDLSAIMEKVEGEIYELKIKGDDAKVSPEISKRLLILEGIRTLQESGMIGLQSPMFDTVINGMIDFVVEDYSLSGMSDADFEESIRDAMKQYRSSKFRFPDEIVEQRVRQGAVDRLSMPPAELPVEEGAPFGFEKRAGAMGGHAASIPDTAAARRAVSVLDAPELSLAPMGDEKPEATGVPFIVDKHGRKVPDPFELQKLKRKQGIVMKERQNLVKNLRMILETEVSQAEVMMAAKGFAQELQEMIEKIGRLQNEDLPPVTDQMRETYGTESSSAFQTQIYGALQGVMDALYSAKGQVDDAVTDLAATGQLGARVDMEKDIEGMDALDGAVDEIGAIDDLDNIEDEIAADEFGGAAGEEPLGRAMKESALLEKRVAEMKRLVERARQLKEARAK